MEYPSAMTQGPASQDPDDSEGPPSGDPPDTAQKWTPVSLPRALAVFLLVVCGGIVALLALSVLVVYLIGLAARRAGVPELSVTIAFLSLLAILVIGYVGASLGSEVQAFGRRVILAIEGAGERVADEMDDSTAAIVETIEELPAVVVDPKLAARAPGGPTNRARRSLR